MQYIRWRKYLKLSFFMLINQELTETDDGSCER